MLDAELANNTFKSIFYHSPIAIEHYDSNGFLIDCNLSCLNLYGINDINQVMGYNLFEEPNLNTQQKKEIKAGRDVRYEIAYDFNNVKKLNLYPTSKNGIIYLDCFITSVKTEDNVITGYLLYIIDITEKRKSEQTLKESETKYKELNATKDKLFSIIAHDLRSPFSSILNISEMLIDNIKTFDIDKHEMFLNSIVSTLKCTLSLLDNLLEWAKLQTGQLTFQPERNNLMPIIQNIIELLGSCAKSKNISVNSDLSTHIEVYADKNILQTVLRNLISNAIKFTNKGGRVDINAYSDQEKVIVTISDNGIGMNEETKNKLFGIDANITTVGTSDEKGSGLGLMLCKELIEKHDGKIWFESELGKGSDFKFSLPHS